MRKFKDAPNEELRDCHYCEFASCENKDDETVDCYVDDFAYFDHEVKDCKKKAEECKWFDYCDCFPKY